MASDRDRRGDRLADPSPGCPDCCGFGAAPPDAPSPGSIGTRSSTMCSPTRDRSPSPDSPSHPRGRRAPPGAFVLPGRLAGPDTARPSTRPPISTSPVSGARWPLPRSICTPQPARRRAAAPSSPNRSSRSASATRAPKRSLRRSGCSTPSTRRSGIRSGSAARPIRTPFSSPISPSGTHHERSAHALASPAARV